MNKKKSIAVAIVLAVVLLIGGLLAYFTDTDTATNVFTLGDKVDISLIETDWSNGGSGTNYTYASANGIHPGATVAKDPKISNNSKTTPAFVFAEVIVPCYDSNNDGKVDEALFELNSIGDGWTVTNNTPEVNIDNKTITYVYAYGNQSTMTSLAAENTTPAVFSSVTLKSTLTAEQKETAGTTNIVVNAYGIQTDSLGVSAPAEIYALFNK